MVQDQAASGGSIGKVAGEAIANDYLPFVANAGDELIGYVVGGQDWCNFFLRTDDCDLTILQQTNDALNVFYGTHDVPSLKQLGLSGMGMPCAVRYAKDQRWYRARLEDPSYGLVRFIDYGNVQMCSENDIKPLTRLFVDIIRPSCIRCTLTKVQDISLPSFVSDNAKVKITVLSVEEPYEVAVQILPATEAAAAAAGTVPTKKIEPPRPIDSRMPGRASPALRPTTMNGLSLLPQPTNGFGEDSEDEDLKGARATASRRAVSQRLPAGPVQQNKYSILNAIGIISDLFATCGVVALANYQARRSEVNTQQSSFCGGPLLVEDLRRIFRSGERVRFNSKLEQPFLTQDMEWSMMVAEDNDPEKKKRKLQQDPENSDRARWLVTDFKPITNENLLISHAVVNFVADAACSLYIRGTEETVWATKGVFPENIARSERSLRDLVDIGRSVIVRAETTDILADFKVNASYIAKAVELVGLTYEEKGTMYLVRDNYSVIITEGNVGFGYVFVANQFVDSGGVPMEDWYGTRVYFRSCPDVPDKMGEDFRYGIRMKALRAYLSPDETKGPYRFAGIFRPPPMGALDDQPGPSDKKKWQTTEDEALDLPTETLQEMAVLGVDTIGMERPVEFKAPETIEMVRENLSNEIRSETIQQRQQMAQGDGPSVAGVPGVPDEAMAKAKAALAKGPRDEVELTSTVEITFEPFEEPVLISLPAPLKPSEPVSTPLPPAALEPLGLLGGNVNGTTVQPPISTAVQTEFDLVPDEVELRRAAIAELRTAVNDTAQLTTVLEFALRLCEQKRGRFWTVMEVAMGNQTEEQ